MSAPIYLLALSEKIVEGVRGTAESRPFHGSFYRAMSRTRHEGEIPECVRAVAGPVMVGLI
jgi:hypothetical protein